MELHGAGEAPCECYGSMELVQMSPGHLLSKGSATVKEG